MLTPHLFYLKSHKPIKATGYFYGLKFIVIKIQFPLLVLFVVERQH